jgi:hypothetical protein
MAKKTESAQTTVRFAERNAKIYPYLGGTT